MWAPWAGERGSVFIASEPTRADHSSRLVSSKPIVRDASEDSLYICAVLDVLVLVLKTTEAILLTVSPRANSQNALTLLLGAIVLIGMKYEL